MEPPAVDVSIDGLSEQPPCDHVSQGEEKGKGDSRSEVGRQDSFDNGAADICDESIVGHGGEPPCVRVSRGEGNGQGDLRSNSSICYDGMSAASFDIEVGGGDETNGQAKFDV